MHHKADTLTAFISGLVGGGVRFMLIETGFLTKLIEAGMTAFVCGMLGVVGKYLIIWLFICIKKRFKK